MSKTIDTERFSAQMRKRGLERETRTIRITRFGGSHQEQDLSEPANCGGCGRVRHFRQETSSGWPRNPLPVLPAARALRVPAPEMLEAQVFQNAVCNWRCWYCFVDFELLSGDKDRSASMTCDRLVELYLAEPERPRVIDLTGGQPDLVPEWVPWMMEALDRAGISESVYLWSDDNLSNDYFWEYLSPQERAAVDCYMNYGKVCCFKGFDPASFSFNTLAAEDLFARQFDLMRRLIEHTEIDLYAYATFTCPDDKGLEHKMSAFVDRLQEMDENLPLRTVPLQISAFTPVRERGITDQQARALTVQEEAIAIWQAEVSHRFSVADRAREICDVPLRGS